MAANLIRSQIIKSKELILNETKEIHGFMDLLMKQRNTGRGWTKAEKNQLKKYIVRLAAYVPILFVFLLPGGFVLIPLLAEVLDRRKHRRHAISAASNKLIEPVLKPCIDSTIPENLPRPGLPQTPENPISN